MAQIDLAQGEEAFQRFEEELQQIQGRFALIVLAEPQEGHQPELVVAVEWREWEEPGKEP